MEEEVGGAEDPTEETGGEGEGGETGSLEEGEVDDESVQINTKCSLAVTICLEDYVKPNLYTKYMLLLLNYLVRNNLLLQLYLLNLPDQTRPIMMIMTTFLMQIIKYVSDKPHHHHVRVKSCHQ